LLISATAKYAKKRVDRMLFLDDVVETAAARVADDYERLDPEVFPRIFSHDKIIALVEEFLFRAAAIGAAALALPVSPWVLAVVSSVGFALGHGAQGRVGVVVTGALGFALAAGFVISGSFVVVVVAHYLVNAMEFAVHEGLGLPDPVWS